MNRKIKKIEAKHFTLICLFDTNETITYDMTNIVMESGSMLLPLRDEVFLKKVFLESGTPTWPNGYDVYPDTIYRQGGRITAA